MPDGETFSSGSRGLTRAGSGATGRSSAYRADSGERAAALRVSTQHRTRGIDVVLAADEERGPLVQLRGLDVDAARSMLSGDPKSRSSLSAVGSVGA